MKLIRSMTFGWALLAAAYTPQTSAATWYLLPTIGAADTAFFFDAETVEKTTGRVTLWIKRVEMVKSDSAGNWGASSRIRFDCVKRTMQTLAFATYDAVGTFLKSYTKPSDVETIFPGSTGEALMKMACAARFPREPSEKSYLPAKNNDVYDTAVEIMVFRKMKESDPAPK